MPTPKDYMKIIEQTEVLMEGGKRQIELASSIQEAMRELLGSLPEKEVEEAEEEMMDGENAPEGREMKKLNIIAIMKRKKK